QCSELGQADWVLLKHVKAFLRHLRFLLLGLLASSSCTRFCDPATCSSSACFSRLSCSISCAGFTGGSLLYDVRETEKTTASGSARSPQEDPRLAERTAVSPYDRDRVLVIPRHPFHGAVESGEQGIAPSVQEVKTTNAGKRLHSNG